MLTAFFRQINNNRLVALPRTIGRLRALRELNVSYCISQLSPVSPALAQMDYNKLTSLPAELSQLTSLELFNVRSWLRATCRD